MVVEVSSGRINDTQPHDTSTMSSLDRIHQALFLPSERLHLNWASSAGIIPSGTPTYLNTGVNHRDIIICHKDRTSFYKCTRKSRRTASRVWTKLFSSNGSTTSEVVACDGYFVGKKRSSSPLSSTSFETRERHSAIGEAIHKRLASEFGQSCDVIDIDIPNASNLTAIKFISGDDNGADDGGSPGESSLNVIFFDLDVIAENDGSAWMHLDFVENILTSSLMQKDAMGSIVHIRSEALYRAVTSSCSIITAQNGVRGVELEKCLSLQNDGSKETADAPIRRLRDGKGAANCPLSMYPARYIELSSPSSSSEDGGSVCIEICRFHNYDSRGCLRSKKAEHNSLLKGCDLDHCHCHRCGEGGHRAIECPHASHMQHISSTVFRKNLDGSVASSPFRGKYHSIPDSLRDTTRVLPALLVMGGRLRGRTLATCEMMPLSNSSSERDSRHWIQLPNLCEHRGSHAACSPNGSKLAFVLGGGTADGNSDAVEVLDFTDRSRPSFVDVACQRDCGISDCEWRWHMMKGRLSSPRHAFGAVSCTTTKGTNDNDAMTSVSIFAVGGWKYGSVSCESVERFSFEFLGADGLSMHRFDSERVKHPQWEICAPLLVPRRLHSVVASTDGSSIYVLGGYVNERRTTSSIERYDVLANTWTAVEELPFNEQNCELVQAVADEDGGILIFPFSTENTKESEAPLVLRYTPGSDTPFLPITLPKHIDKQQQLRLPVANWHSFSATRSASLNKAFLVGGTINGKWTNRSYELDLNSFEWTELPAMTFARRRLTAVVLE